jgi:hypothetical protein
VGRLPRRRRRREAVGGRQLASIALGTVIIPPLVTALLVVVVQGLARAQEPTVGAALRLAGPRLPAALGAVVLYSLGVALGFVALIVPGVWLSVRWYFGPQAAVVDGLGPADALRRSAEVVQTRWWRTFGVLLAFGLLTGIFGAVIGAAIRSIDNGAIYTSAQVLLQAGLLSLTAIFGTLLFFDSRARAHVPWQGPPPPAVRPSRSVRSSRLASRVRGVIERYTRPALGAIWTDEARMEAWRRVEVAACEEMDGPTEADLEAIRGATFTVDAVKERERITDHDVAAFVDVLSESAGAAPGRWIHFGLTSSDVLDTALALLIRDAGKIVLAGSRELRRGARRPRAQHVDTVCVGRTHGVHAEPTTFGR